MVHYAEGSPNGELTLRTLAMPADAKCGRRHFWRLGDGADGSGLRHPRRRAGEGSRRDRSGEGDVFRPSR